MIGIYFSGTGNSRYALEVFIREYGNNSVLFSIEDINLIEHINSHDEIVFSYPVQYSAVPKILSDFIHNNSSVWQGKRVFIIATMALFSGDGAGVLGRLLKQYGAKITGGLHLQMPDSIADENLLFSFSSYRSDFLHILLRLDRLPARRFYYDSSCKQLTVDCIFKELNTAVFMSDVVQ